MPSANCFADCQKSGTRQRPSLPSAALGKELHSAKSSLPSVGHLTKKKALGKGLLCRVSGSRQKRDIRHRLPRVTVFGHVLLCRAPAVRHSAKIFFLGNTLPSAPDTALGKDSIFCFEIHLPSAFGKEEISKKIQKTSLPSALFLALGKDPLCRVPSSDARQSFFCFWPPNFLCSPFKAPGTPR